MLVTSASSYSSWALPRNISFARLIKWSGMGYWLLHWRKPPNGPTGYSTHTGSHTLHYLISELCRFNKHTWSPSVTARCSMTKHTASEQWWGSLMWFSFICTSWEHTQTSIQPHATPHFTCSVHCTFIRAFMLCALFVFVSCTEHSDSFHRDGCGNSLCDHECFSFTWRPSGGSITAQTCHHTLVVDIFNMAPTSLGSPTQLWVC